MGTDQHTIEKAVLACRPYCFPEITKMRQLVESEKTGGFTRIVEGMDPSERDACAANGEPSQAERCAFEAGYQQGHAAAGAAVGKELSSLIENLRRAFDKMDRWQTKLYHQVERESVRLALDVARKIVWQELQSDPDIVVHVMRKALGAMADAHRLIVRMHPEDVARLRSLEDDGTLMLSEHNENIRIEADDSISKGGCRICSGSAELDATVESRLQMVTSAFEALLPVTGDDASAGEDHAN